MPSGYYELLSLGARYVFVAVMLLILVRAIRGTLIDARRAAELRRLSPDTGVVGELIVQSGSGRTRKGMRFPVIQEGLIGRQSSADIRLRSRSIHRRHAYFRYHNGVLTVQARANAALYDKTDERRGVLRLSDGDCFYAGDLQLLLVLNDTESGTARRRSRPERETPADEGEDALFDVDDPYDGE